MKLQYIHKFNHESAFECLSDTDVRDLGEHVAPLVPTIDEDELAKRFDYLMYTIEYADLKRVPATKPKNPKNPVVSTAEKLTYQGTIEEVKQQKGLIYKVQTNEYRAVADIFDHEEVREALRNLIKFLDTQSGKIYYTNFTNEIMETRENPGEYSVNDMQSYRRNVNKYLMEHQNDLVIYKLRSNRPLLQEDIKYLEKILWQDIGTREDYEKEFGDEPLLKLVSNIVGLDPQAANETFSTFCRMKT